MRAIRTHPKLRKSLILQSAVSVAGRIGLSNLNRINVAYHAAVSPASVSRYFITIKRLRMAVIRYAIKHEILPILAESYTQCGKLVNNALRKKVLNYLAMQHHSPP